MEDELKRRALPRYPCTGTVEIFQSGQLYGWGTVSEISRGGCYIDTNQPMPVAAAVNLRISLVGEILEAGAKVAWTTPQVGMGMRFEVSSPELESRIERMLQIITGEDGGSRSPGGQPSEFPILAHAALDSGTELDLDHGGISPEAATKILAKVIERVNQAGALTRQELMEIVKAGPQQ